MQQVTENLLLLRINYYQLINFGARGVLPLIPGKIYPGDRAIDIMISR